MKNCQSQGKINLFANVLENIAIACFISIFYQSIIRFINVTFCYTADKLKSGAISRSGQSQRK